MKITAFWARFCPEERDNSSSECMVHTYQTTPHKTVIYIWYDPSDGRISNEITRHHIPQNNNLHDEVAGSFVTLITFYQSNDVMPLRQ
jgi:hypothetical protein